MKKFFKLTTIAAYAVMMICSCLPESDMIMSNNVALADWKDGVLYTDEGNKYIITENVGNVIPESVSRVYLTCDVLTLISDNEYTIRLKDWEEVQVKQTLKKSAMEDRYKDESGNLFTNPVNLNNGWFSKGNINMILDYFYVEGSKVEHEFDLMFDDIKSNSDTVYFKILHDAHGEYYGSITVPDSNLKANTRYVSFPIQEFLPKDADKVVFNLEWCWHITSQGTLQKETGTFSDNATLKLR